MVHRTIDSEMDRFANEKLYPEEWTLDGLIKEAENIYAPKGVLVQSELEAMSRDELKDKLYKTAEDNYNQREKLFGSEVMRDLERIIMLKVVDNKWMNILTIWICSAKVSACVPTVREIRSLNTKSKVIICSRK